MKIAILTSGILPVPAVQGGAVENLIDFYLEYNDKNKLHDITVYSVFHPDVKKHIALNSNVNHYHYINITSTLARLKRKIYYYIREKEPFNHYIGYFLYEAIKHLKKQNYDMVILENRPSYALKLFDVTNAKLVYHIHNELLTNATPYCKTIYNAAYKIITVSDYIKKSIQTINPADSKCITVHNGIDLDAFCKRKRETIKREYLGFERNDFILVFSGRLNKDKGISELIDAMLMLKDYPNIKLLIIGNSFFANATKDNIFLIELKRKAKQAIEKIHFTGFVPYSDIPSYLHLSDIAVLPSVWEEPFGLTMLEAMAAGIPLITTNKGGIPEVCKGAAIMLQSNNLAQELTDTILTLYNDPQKRQDMSQSSIRRASLFSKKKYVENLYSAIKPYDNNE